VGSKVRIAIGLPRGEKLSGLTKVVHVVTPSQASALHRPAGAGLSFLRSDQKLMERIAALTAEYERPPPRLLVVDDDDDFRAALADALRVTGMKVDEARTGEEALSKLVDTLFELDVVLLDIRMPGMDGRGFLDRVRRLGGELDLRIIVLSAAPRAELLALKGPGAANDALSKADDLSEIVNRIKLVVGKDAGADDHSDAS
jgi:CheY-like chemotaxis protein